MGTLFWVVGAIIAATIALIIVFAACLIGGACRRWFLRRHTATAEHHAPLQQ